MVTTPWSAWWKCGEILEQAETHVDDSWCAWVSRSSNSAKYWNLNLADLPRALDAAILALADDPLVHYMRDTPVSVIYAAMKLCGWLFLNRIRNESLTRRCSRWKLALYGLVIFATRQRWSLTAVMRILFSEFNIPFRLEFGSLSHLISKDPNRKLGPIDRLLDYLAIRIFLRVLRSCTRSKEQKNVWCMLLPTTVKCSDDI